MFYLLLEDVAIKCPEDVSLRQFRGRTVTLKRGTIFKDFYGFKDIDSKKHIVVSNYHNDVFGRRIAFKENSLLEVPGDNNIYISPLTGSRADILSGRTDYMLDGVSIISNVKALDFILKELNTNLKAFDIFKYKPLKLNSLLGFNKNGKFIEVNKDYIENVVYLNYLKDTNINNCIPSTEPLLKFCTFKVINYLESARLFKFTEAKKKLVGKTVQVENIELDVETKTSTERVNTLYVLTEEGKRLRFLLSDIEIIYPNINGYNLPKDRSIKEGSVVRVKDDRRIGIKRNEQVKVLNVKSVGNKKYVQIEFRDKKLYTPLNKLRVL